MPVHRFMDALFACEKKVKEIIRAQSEGLFMERPTLLLFDVRLKGKAIISNRGTSRYLKIAEGETENTYVLNEEKIALDAKWDGLHGMETDLPLGSEREIREALSHYHFDRAIQINPNYQPAIEAREKM